MTDQSASFVGSIPEYYDALQKELGANLSLEALVITCKKA